MKPVGAIAVVVLMAAACASGPVVTPDTSNRSEPTITMASVSAAAEWSPAWIPPVDVLADLRPALRQGRMWMILPSEEPDPTVGELTAAVQISQRIPSGGSTGEIIMRRADESVYVSVQFIPADGEPICGTRLSDPVNREWLPETVRGEPGCTLVVLDAVSMVAWTEDGQNLIAQFGPELKLAALISWLATWESV